MKALIAATALATLFVAGHAMADEMSGTVKSVDMKNHMITMDDGMSVTTNPDVKLDGVMKGDKVTVTTDQDHMGTMVEKKK